jgi:hypothetical protein
MLEDIRIDKMANTEPTPPDEIAQYIIDGLRRQGPEELELIEEYTRELREYRIGRQSESIDEEELDVDESTEVVDVQDSDEGTVVIRKNDCGSDCKGCPHGPYKYIVTPDGQGGQNWEYKGKVESE